MINRTQRGFTIMELMTVVAIVAILASFALPSFRDLVQRSRLKTAASDFHTSLTFARSEAIKRNGTVSVVPADASDWSRGWSVQFGGNPLIVQDPYASLSIAPRSASYGTKTVSSVDFQGTGREGSSDGIAFIVTAAGFPTISARCVVLDPSGRAAVRQDKNSNPSDGCN
jgi:type IV fimbrial biogenesis protein FimT